MKTLAVILLLLFGVPDVLAEQIKTCPMLQSGKNWVLRCGPPPVRFKYDEVRPPFDAPLRYLRTEITGGVTNWVYAKDGPASRECTPQEASSDQNKARMCAAKIGDPYLTFQAFDVVPQ